MYKNVYTVEPLSKRPIMSSVECVSGKHSQHKHALIEGDINNLILGFANHNFVLQKHS